MPSVLYLSSGDEFVVTVAYADALGALTLPLPRIEFEAIEWRDPDGEDFDEDEDEGATYSEVPLTVCTSCIVAIKRVSPHVNASIDRARAHQP